MEDRLKSYGREAAKKISKYGSYAKVPYLDAYVQNLAGGFRYLVLETISNTLICIDDLECRENTYVQRILWVWYHS